MFNVSDVFQLLVQEWLSLSYNRRRQGEVCLWLTVSVPYWLDLPRLDLCQRVECEGITRYL